LCEITANIQIMEQLYNYIDGKLVSPANGNYLDNIDPSTGNVFSQIPDSDAADVEAAVQAAEGAFHLWSTIGNEARGKYLDKLADYIEANLEEFVRAESLDNGKPITLSRNMDIPRAVSNLRFFASAIQHFASEAHHTEQPNAINYTLRRPIGTVGCISPWNLPLYLFTWKIAPALAAGNCVIAKPSEVTPYTAYLLAKAAVAINLPNGVLNIVHGLGAKAGQAIVEHPQIKAISFTGGTATGAHLARTAAPMFKKLSLELGGKNPTIIFADCDYNDMLATTVRSAFTNQGQICLCGSRIFVERRMYDQFKTDFLHKVALLKCGDPQSETTNFGAIVSEAHLQKVLSYIALAQAEGGTVLCGGERVQLTGAQAGGYYLAPTVIEGLSPHCRTNQEEIFGPVVTITPFDYEAEVIEYANSTVYGLAASVWTQNLARAHRVAEQLAFGIVWTNCWLLRDLRTPFGGAKQSGVGREGGWEALRFFTEAKNVCIKY
jgi:aminomuconate-semialdehyde/2-hydroxymuconate-6-semialdehyde dehydrogenase